MCMHTHLLNSHIRATKSLKKHHVVDGDSMTKLCAGNLTQRLEYEKVEVQ